MNVLITGGAGYIGSSVAWLFIDKGHKVTIIDNLIKGKKSNIPKKSKFINSDIADIKKLKKDINEKYDVVLHFAALIDNQESILNKNMYLNNNFIKAKIFLDFCIKKGIKNFIFSSSAAVYGPSSRAVHENSKTKPLAPYGQSKLKFEKILKKTKNNINYVILRYFNVVGAEKKLRCGFETKKNKGLFNSLCKSYFGNINFHVFGKDFKTNDGTAIRDFIYIGDLSEIHYKFSKIINERKIRQVVNCGYGKGYSVLDIVKKFNFILKKSINFEFKNSRKDEISYSVANTKKLQKFYNLKAKKNILFTMINTTLKWYKKTN